MEVGQLLANRTAQEETARASRKREQGKKAEKRAIAREAAAAEKVENIQSQINKWNEIGVSAANSYTLAMPVIQPLGSHLSTRNLTFSRFPSPSLCPRLTGIL